MIADNNTITTIVINKELYKKAKDKAKERNRSFANYVCNLIKKDLEGENENEK